MLDYGLPSWPSLILVKKKKACVHIRYSELLAEKDFHV